MLLETTPYDGIEQLTIPGLYEIPAKCKAVLVIIIMITRSIIVSEMTKSLHRHYGRFRERMTEEMGLQMFPENRY